MFHSIQLQAFVTGTYKQKSFEFLEFNDFGGKNDEPWVTQKQDFINAFVKMFLKHDNQYVNNGCYLSTEAFVQFRKTQMSQMTKRAKGICFTDLKHVILKEYNYQYYKAKAFSYESVRKELKQLPRYRTQLIEIEKHCQDSERCDKIVFKFADGRMFSFNAFQSRKLSKESSSREVKTVEIGDQIQLRQISTDMEMKDLRLEDQNGHIIAETTRNAQCDYKQTIQEGFELVNISSRTVTVEYYDEKDKDIIRGFKIGGKQKTEDVEVIIFECRSN